MKVSQACRISPVLKVFLIPVVCNWMSSKDSGAHTLSFEEVIRLQELLADLSGTESGQRIGPL